MKIAAPTDLVATDEIEMIEIPNVPIAHRLVDALRDAQAQALVRKEQLA